ncbi:probable disease resistance RPP8-like protein 2 isoform X1 [Trifolium pratense]|uniref:probable disease resistance RPP8-like protein 2 isoform X1 n=1 Tax=Trifolium pratense TaxID=57577 RepID=UPI001E695D9F|nr:probable disease resistance RPP8-like protein 2 isoform X1 [Trifolium pratense]
MTDKSHDCKMVSSNKNTLFYIRTQGRRWLNNQMVHMIRLIEGELTRKQEVSELIRLRGHSRNKAYFKKWEKDFEDVTDDIENVIKNLMSSRSSAMNRFEEFVIHSNLEDIVRKIAGINDKPKFDVSVESPHEEASSSSSSPTSSHLLDDETSLMVFKFHLKVKLKLKLKQKHLEKVGREIVMKCGGLESQIHQMCDLLSHQDVPRTHEAWTKVLEGPLFNISQKHNWSKTVHKINRQISHQLRTCLFYFVYFPVEFEISVRRLIVLWVAEGLISHLNRGETPELVAQRYLEELIDNGMVQVVKRKPNGKVKTCRLPSALRQLWLTQTYEFRDLQNHTTTSPDSNVQLKKNIISRVADHLLDGNIWNNHIHGDTTDSTTLKTYYKKVISFLSFDTREGSKPGQQVGHFLKGCISSDCFLLLRVLDLEGVYKPKLPKRIKRLTQLTYLGLRWTYLESLPSSISSLLKLQTLDLKHTSIHTIPSSVWKMELRHLFLSETYRTKFPPKPKDEDTTVKDGLDKLANIKKLRLACQSMSLNQDTMIAQLEAVADWISTLVHLQSLRLKSRNEKGEPWNLHLKSFEKNVSLTNMYLLGSLRRSSILLSDFPHRLIELTLSHSKLEDDPMITLKDFPYLQKLCLLAESYTETSMVCKPQSFPQLQVLKIWVLERLQEWNIEHGALPCLKQLEIRSCQNLQRLPDGLKHVNTLLELKLTNMPKEINAGPDNIPPNCKVV